MKRAILFYIIISGLVNSAAADDILSRSDRLYLERKNEKAIGLLLAALEEAPSDPARVEVLWRLARHSLDSGDALYEKGFSPEELLSIYDQGMEYADRAVKLDPAAYQGYFWKAANIGRWAQMKGILTALFQAKPMRDLLVTAVGIYPDYGEAWYVLGMMYELLPGFPLSFGDKAYAVSLGRKSLEANRVEMAAGQVNIVRYGYYIELANHLWARDWSVSKRRREHTKMASGYTSETGMFEKNCYYEAIVELEDISDREEAKNIMRRVIHEMASRTALAPGEQSDLGRAREILSSWR